MQNQMNKLIVSLILGILIGCIVTSSFKCKPTNSISKPDTVVIDSSKVIHDTITSKPELIKSESIKWDTISEYIADTNYVKLLIQYKTLSDSLFTKKYYTKIYQIDTFGTLTVDDTVFKNNLIGQSISYNLKIPKKIIKVTTTESYKPKTQLYFGGAMSGNKTNNINTIESSLLLKNKKDVIYQLGLEQNVINSTTTIKLGYYKKL